MKTTTRLFTLMTAVLIISMANELSAQGRGHHRGHDRDREHDERRRDRDDDRDNHNQHGRDNHWNYSNTYERTSGREVYHYHDRSCRHEPIVVHHHYTRPRYVYYRDYDVYYDFRNNTYITLIGRNWVVTSAVPARMQRVDLRRAACLEVDYDRDDFPRYLERRRPIYTRAYNGW